jgi:hypothetical protein
MSIVPHEVAWDDFGCTVCLHCVNLFNHCPCLLTKLWIEMGRVQIDYNCHTICCVVHCPRQVAISWFAVAYLLLYESFQPLSLPPCKILDQDGTRKIDFHVVTYIW